MGQAETHPADRAWFPGRRTPGLQGPHGLGFFRILRWRQSCLLLDRTKAQQRGKGVQLRQGNPHWKLEAHRLPYIYACIKKGLQPTPEFNINLLGALRKDLGDSMGNARASHHQVGGWESMLGDSYYSRLFP